MNETKVPAKEVKKGDRVRLANGWEADMMQPGNRTTPLAKVYGFVTEMGSVYGHDIAFVKRGEEWLPVEHTKAQLKCKEFARVAGF